MAGKRIEYKTCLRCGYEKRTTDFYRRSSALDGLQPLCKACSDRAVLSANAKDAGNATEDGFLVCVRCKEAKPATDFGRNKRYASGRHHTCTVCMNISWKKFRKGMTAEQRLRINETRRARYAHVRDELADKGTRRKFNLPRNWSYSEMLARQNGVCAICGRDKNLGGRKFAVDHCHKTNVVRGLLCTWCNQALGQLQDSPELLRKAADYIETHRPQI